MSWWTLNSAIMYLQIKQIDQKIIEQSMIFFWEKFTTDLKVLKPSTFSESLVARYLIKRSPDKYSSISHKTGLVFVWSHDKELWVDIEILKPRDISLQDIFPENDYGLLWIKNWKSFYVLWTAHEAIVKFDREQHYKTGMYKLLEITIQAEIISKIPFSKQMIFECWEKKYKVVSWEQNGYIYSVCLTN